MAFRKAKAEQAALKIAIYGPPGSGKTFTSLLIAEGLATQAKKRIAYVDTERGTDFYCKRVTERSAHPEPFDFDAIYTRSLTEVDREIRALNTDHYAVVVVDSITHLWEAAIGAYKGNMTRAQTIPMTAWGTIKRPYKAMFAYMLSSPMHVIVCGRQGNEFAEDENTGELKRVGVKMKAEGETPYEPHILIRMECGRAKPGEIAPVFATAEKDRSGMLAGRTIMNPTFDTLARPLLSLLGDTQATIQSEDETASQDAEALAAAEAEREARSAELLRKFSAEFRLADTAAAVEAVSKRITAALKKDMLPADVDALREAYRAALARVGSK